MERQLPVETVTFSRPQRRGTHRLCLLRRTAFGQKQSVLE